MAESPTVYDRIKNALRIDRAVGLAWRTAPRWSLVNVVLVLAQGALPLASLFLMKRIVDAITLRIATPDKTAAFQQVLIWIALAAGAAILTALTRLLSDYASEAQAIQVTDVVADMLHAQSIALDLDYYEDAGNYDTLHRAQSEAPFRTTRIVNGLVQIAQNSVALIGIAGMLCTFNWLLAMGLFLATLPGAFIRIVHARRLFDFEQEHTERERLSWYFHSLLTEVEYAKELRLFDIGELFRTRYRELRRQIRTGKLGIVRRRVLSDWLSQAIAACALFGLLAWIAQQTIRGRITLGDLVAYYLGFQLGLTYLQALLRGLAGLYEDNMFLANLYQFLDLRPRIAAPARPRAMPQPMPRAIAFRNVGFTYPSRTEEALHDIDLTLAPGEVIALVGENGSGKTTLVKLLCRLYEPTSGAITVDGVDLRELDPVEWRREISVTFQDYSHYALAAWENIWLGDVQTLPDRVGIEAAGRRSGADAVIGRLPNGYDTMLGHRFKEGQELSGGEWQKVALARTFRRDARILVLDEPSSSLDPLAEENLFHEFRDLLAGRSAILISHRFSTVQMADRICVLEHGRIVEQGTHTALLEQNGRYARLYRSQAQHFQ